MDAELDEHISDLVEARTEVERLSNLYENENQVATERLAEVERLRAAAQDFLDAEDAWFLVSDARPYDPKLAADRAHKRRKAVDALRASLVQEEK